MKGNIQNLIEIKEKKDKLEKKLKDLNLAKDVIIKPRLRKIMNVIIFILSILLIVFLFTMELTPTNMLIYFGNVMILTIIIVAIKECLELSARIVDKSLLNLKNKEIEKEEKECSEKLEKLVKIESDIENNLNLSDFDEVYGLVELNEKDLEKIDVYYEEYKKKVSAKLREINKKNIKLKEIKELKRTINERKTEKQIKII